MSRELAEFFGAPVIVQFRDALALATSEATQPKQYLVIDENGQPRVGESSNGITYIVGQLFEPTEQLEDVQGERRPKYSFTVHGRILPAPNERVYVLYETNGFIVKMAVHPRDIVAVTSIEGRLEEKRIVNPS